MAQPPSTKKIIASDLPDDWQAAKEKLLLPLNKFLSDANDGLSAGLRLDANLGCQVWTFRVQVPAQWQTPTFANSWTNYGSPEATAGYTKTADGLVFLKGGLKGGTLGAAAFMLPAAYCPAERMQCVCYYFNGTSAAPGLVYVEANGDVKPAGSTNFYVSLAGISFPCSNFSPYVPSCFPLKFKCTLPGGRAQKLELGEVVDVTPGSTPLVHNATEAIWRNDAGQITIDNIPGLLPGRTYSIRAIAYPF